MRPETILSLVVAICRYLEIPPEEIAKFFSQYTDNQEYYDLVLRAYQESTK